MKKYIIVLLCLLFAVNQVIAQKTIALDKNQSKQFDQNDSLSKKNKVKGFKDKASIEQYKLFGVNGNESIVDTSLTLQKAYKFNYLRKDNFGLMPLANIGQGYNQLTRDFNHRHVLPQFGARARHFNYMEAEDTKYYEVPTPLTELFFKTAFKQGQLLDAFFTVNTSKQFNFSIAYKGLRSLGNYQHVLTSTGNLRFTTNFKTKNQKYSFKAHITTQDLLNQENGGLRAEDLENFNSGNEDFIDRAVFDPNFQNAENILVGKRFYLNQQYNIKTAKDSLDSSLSIKNIISFEDKYYQFDQTSSEDFFGESFNQSNIRDRVTLENFETSVFVNYKNVFLGDLNLGVGYNDINYGYDKVTLINNIQIPNRIQDQLVNLGVNYINQIGKINFDFEFKTNIYGDFDSSFFNGKASYQYSDDIKLIGNVNANTNAANYNLLLYQSDYINYNWNNTESFKNEKTKNVGFKFESQKLVSLSVQYSNLDNFSLFRFNEDLNAIKPTQIDQSISLLKVKLEKEIKLGKFALDNTILYQRVYDNSNSLNLPELVTRNTFYYSNHFFKNDALFLQTGITFNYFTKYYMDGYDPLLAEFYTQNRVMLGDFPRLDFFINAKVRQTRIYLKAEHLNASFTGYDYFSAPNNPYRDFNIRFGIVWNFFL
ncbi:Putative porin [Formosa sp. Hel1_31_208]|uniref:putative porin n=1 Tax=Formosa sp. Hel1_31_208 TaxID=1798225 RepID=UPI00087C199D|nr:putative porin [Formosa sp. Hel1_31_208]SDR65600.1 Putative porin [Formosa sp. Hel1_31_208]